MNMEDPHIIFGITNLSSGILFILISLPLAAGKIPMNPLYGFRIKEALISEENWYRINQYGGRQLIKWSCVLVGIGILNFVFPSAEHYNIIQNILYAVGPILICIFVVITKTRLFAKPMGK